MTKEQFKNALTVLIYEYNSNSDNYIKLKLVDIRIHEAEDGTLSFQGVVKNA